MADPMKRRQEVAIEPVKTEDVPECCSKVFGTDFVNVELSEIAAERAGFATFEECPNRTLSDVW